MLTPYSYSKLKNSLVYKFTTKSEIIYQVHFVKDGTLTYLSGTKVFEQVYQIVIEKTTDNTEPFDSRVFLTIEAIIIEFFNDTAKVLSFVCDTSDGKQIARFKKFNRWHEKSKHNQSIIKLNDNYTDTDVELFYSIMIHKSNPKFKHLKSAFFSIKELLINDKP